MQQTTDLYSLWHEVAQLAKLGNKWHCCTCENGYSILETNWRLGRHEADIIACKDGVIAFVEVKTRSSLRFGTPQEAVDYNKQRTYMRLANAYVRMKKRTEEVRFDIIAIEINREGFNLNL